MCRYMYNRSMTNNKTTKENNMTKQEIISLARKNGVSTHVLHAMTWADELILKGDRVLCLHDSPNECDTSFDISKK